MKKAILNLGKTLNRAEQKSINGRGGVLSLRPCECFSPGIPNIQPCDWSSRSIDCDGLSDDICLFFPNTPGC
ncbi:hypothetical protein [uncultured Tenacibaculum sp.]|uniref:hypothetical protein n=1 Tax=Tenacibaculum halocynthiae TaxID=1254437 RepID=UPI0026083077|nr:hypothetical protein [uncultured Tenacibaculum sp.]